MTRRRVWKFSHWKLIGNWKLEIFAMKANIIAPHKIIYQGDISSITLPGIQGQLTILKNHIPLITSLVKGKIKIKDKNKKQLFFDIEQGILEVQPNQVNVLATAIPN
jgi:F-type H+-transporting ATPase subunit epsilon